MLHSARLLLKAALKLLLIAGMLLATRATPWRSMAAACDVRDREQGVLR